MERKCERQYCACDGSCKNPAYFWHNHNSSGVNYYPNEKYKVIVVNEDGQVVKYD